jgi:hypothetical protein
VRLLRFISRAGIFRGFLGGSRAWSVVASVALGLRLLRRFVGAAPETAYSEELGPGDCLVITRRETRVVRAPS